jgi:two-component system sensor histidine kinase RegB
MREDLPDGSLAEDTDLIIEQAARCRDILDKLRNLDADNGDPFSHLALSELLTEVARPHEEIGNLLTIVKADHQGEEPVVPRNIGLLHGLDNLIENAAQFAESEVNIIISWHEGAFSIEIADDGPGFPSDMIAQLGDPYLTSRARQQGADPAEPGGLGLGIFISKTLLERTGAELSFFNQPAKGGATSRINWPNGLQLPA